MRDTRDILGELYDRGDSMLVFPSQVTAARWRIALAADSRRRAVRSDRIVSWDVFKERTVPVKRDAIPASSLARRAFVGALLRDNAAQPFLRALVDPRHADTGVASAAAIARMLPQLPVLLAYTHLIRPDVSRDLRLLSDRYRRFMEQHGVFEPEWELHRSVDLTVLPWRPVIVWPELLEDFRDYEGLFFGAVETVPLPDPADHPPLPVARYATLHQEIAGACSAIEAALDEGTPGHRIVVSVADPDTMGPILRQEARRRGIPLRFGEGEPLARQPGGAIFGRLREAVDGNLAVGALAGLLLDGSVPWKQPDTNRAIVRFGYATHCYTATRWDEAFDLAERVFASGDPRLIPVSRDQLPVLRDRWDSLRRGLRSIAGAESAAALQRAVRAFRDRHFAPAGAPEWSAAGETVERVWETAMTELASIVALERRGVPIPSPWSFFLDALEERRYVARGDTGAVTVYPYRVAAGIPAARHLVLGVSQRATRVRSAPPVALRQAELRRMEWDLRDRSAAFLTAYGYLVSETRLSYADSTPTGAQVPAAELALDEPSLTVPPADSWRREQRWWVQAAAAPPTYVSPAQAEGLDRGLRTALVPAATDYQRQPVDPEILALHPPPDTYSPSAIDTYVDCPFGFWVQRVLRVREEDRGFVPDRRIVLGEVFHRILEDALALPPARREAELPYIVADQFQRDEARLLLAPVARRQWIAFAGDVIARLVEQPPLAAARPGTSEAPVTGEIGGVPIAGRIDRIVGVHGWDGSSGEFDDEPPVIVDYKLKLRDKHRPGAVTGGREHDPWESRTLQLPIYATLLGAAAGRDVAAVIYVGLETAEVRPVGGSDGAELAAIRAALPEFIAAMDAEIRAGRVSCRDDGECDRCRIRSVCRSCFVTRRYRERTS